MASKRFVYILKSESNPARYYTGLTADMHLRLADHTEGRCRHTSSGTPLARPSSLDAGLAR